MTNFLRKLIAGKSAKVVQQRSEEAHDIKNAMQEDVLRIKKKIDKINEDTYEKLKEVSVELDSVTYKIAVATGAKKRGLK